MEEIENIEEMRECHACGQMTIKHTVTSDCPECQGNGFYESDDWQDYDKAETCSGCLGSGVIIHNLFYCSQECFEDDF